MNNFYAALPSIRPPFLLLAPICVCFGASIAAYLQMPFNTLHFILAILGAFLAGIAVNTLNEYQDNQSGLDLITEKTPFSGGSGLLGKHPELASTVIKITFISTLLLFFIGCYFCYVVGVEVAYLGLFGLAIIGLYTKWLNKIPFACLIAPGLGFGVLIPLGSYWVITDSSTVNDIVWQLTFIPFLLINNLLLLNQYPDIKADKTAGRNHIVIKYGVNTANYIYFISALLTAVLIVVLYLYYQLPVAFLLSLLPCSLSFISFGGMVLYKENIALQPRFMVMNVVSANATPVVIALALSST